MKVHQVFWWGEDEMMDLNEANVRKVFSDCLANEKTDTEYIVESKFFDESVQIPMQTVKFDQLKLNDNMFKICYLLGQLKVVHDRKEDGFQPTEGFINYEGEKWTENKIALFALYYMGAAVYEFPKFKAQDSKLLSQISTSVNKTFNSKHICYSDVEKVEDLLKHGEYMDNQVGFIRYFNGLPKSEQKKLMNCLYYLTLGYDYGELAINEEIHLEALLEEANNPIWSEEDIRISWEVTKNNSLIHGLAEGWKIEDILQRSVAERMWFVVFLKGLGLI